MNIELHIEHLVLDGLPLTPRQGRTVQGELEGELVRLLEQHGMGRVSGAALPSLSVAPIQLSPGGEPAQWGRQIAHTLFAGLAPAMPANRRPQKAPAGASGPRRTTAPMNSVSLSQQIISGDSKP